MNELARVNNSFFNLEPFDVMVRNLFDSDSLFSSVLDRSCRLDYPVDIKEAKDGLEIDIAAVGLTRDDIDLQIKDGDTLVVEYKKEDRQEDKEQHYIRKGIARRAFRFAWKIAPKFNLSDISAKMENGLLQLKVPVAPEAQPKQITID